MRQGAFWNVSFEPQLISPPKLIDISNGNIFLRFFERFGGPGLSSNSFTIEQPDPITQ